MPNAPSPSPPSPLPNIDADAHWMRLALAEARRAYWLTHPNPMVGAVVVRDGQVLATGYHARAGEAHAEVDALRKLGMQAPGADLYVTLEPCHHVGRTGPCTQAIIDAQIRRCVVGVIDPDPRVSGKGVAALRAAGIACDVGVEEEACASLNAPFMTRVRDRRPFVTAKVAMTMDGRIATRAGHSRWITGDAAREEVHAMRALHDAVIVGTQTAALDDPALTVRLPARPDARQPLRVVLDRALRLPMTHKVFTDGAAQTLWVVSPSREGEARQRVGALPHPGRVDVLAIPDAARGDGLDSGAGLAGLAGFSGFAGLDLAALLTALAARDITTALCEGGGQLLASLLRAGLVDRYVAYVAPCIVGGLSAPGPVGGEGVAHMDDASRWRWVDARQVGEDFRLEAAPARSALADRAARR
jgi:diaminohydroxyphosphoribosylaminopyrimidine deaminase / 5-amino-6-(5-phosphoribosylamino)uracil reductase